jgi:hypothetical protein
MYFIVMITAALDSAIYQVMACCPFDSHESRDHDIRQKLPLYHGTALGINFDDDESKWPS